MFLCFPNQNASYLLPFLYFIADQSVACRRKVGNKKDRKGLRLHTVGIILTEASISNFYKGTGPHSMIILREMLILNEHNFSYCCCMMFVSNDFKLCCLKHKCHYF